MFAWDRRPANQGAEKIVRQQCYWLPKSSFLTKVATDKKPGLKGGIVCWRRNWCIENQSHCNISIQALYLLLLDMGMVISAGLNMGMLGVYWTKISWIHSEISIDEPFFGHREGNHPRFSHPLVLLNDDMWANTENTFSLPGWTSIVWSLGFKTQRIAAKEQKRAHHITFLIKNRSLVQKQFYVRQNNVQSFLWQLAMSLVA